MPELPEVEVVRRGLEDHVVGYTFRSVEVLHPRAVLGNDADLTEVLPGLTVTGTGRRGKFMWLELSDGNALLVHLRMSGQMIVGKPGMANSRHLRIRSVLERDGEEIELAFIDQRIFGSWQWVPMTFDRDLTVPANIPHIAPDPFEQSFDVVEVARTMRRKNVAVKTILLDQSVVSGIGSIYADEAMWAVGVKPTRKGKTLRQRDAVALLEESREVMARALEAGGTSFDALYVNVDGASGYFARSLNAYGREDEPCPRCGAPIHRTTVNQRSSYYCPECQTL
ncbi:bifunctional DNA-formamidopyrimidine glycosylase/DNA-(apurinic or apyrimidinic site) lyase [Corynebacterium sp. MSK041]|uniref:bifunctional DNA-formamidopyrimidine glycosylase/DNA-(apurinic or apyrimidinic site) lyase n=1 Tax=Corynebacterium sp. MSK041 TaxID=3050194 RepID=UPI00254B3A5B|nr:bifunctional DNA-formamidopyrimidine glycosylase/DNA-(apurinic or apyrimidinic site) lyase [Corynebacterium sp. MSK041]MDK8794400.1 bifunctional DNA-formamidopyrimidine glycosylase/DNA-(apurinic or apyrimidinic site) lyase [Corynebacterium sp. MSK041]